MTTPSTTSSSPDKPRITLLAEGRLIDVVEVHVEQERGVENVYGGPGGTIVGFNTRTPYYVIKALVPASSSHMQWLLDFTRTASAFYAEDRWFLYMEEMDQRISLTGFWMVARTESSFDGSVQFTLRGQGVKFDDIVSFVLGE